MSTKVYPGGSLADKNAVGCDWSKNFINNLFAAKAVNGADKPGQDLDRWANDILSVSFALFFIHSSKKIPAKNAARIMKYLGARGMLFTFLIVTPLHNIMILLSSTMFLVSRFYSTVFIVKSRRHLFKFLCIICLIIFYFTFYPYGSGNYGLLLIRNTAALTS